MYGNLINDCIEHALGEVTVGVSMTYILEHVAQELQCEYGFIGETRYSTEGNPYYRIHALLGFPGTSSCMANFSRDQYIDVIQPDTLHDATFRSGKDSTDSKDRTGSPVICNDVPAHRHGKPLPDGHPEMKNFALFPLKRHSVHIGAIALSSKTVDFTEEWQNRISPLINMTCNALSIHLEKRASELHKVAFLANISHELRTPLNGIVCMANMLKETEMNTEQTETLNVISHCNVQMLDIVNDVLDFTKIFTGGIILRKRPFSLKSCAQSIIDALRPADQSEVTLKLVYNTKIDMIIGDETRVTQIFLNLLNNSFKFTKKGSIVLTIDDEPPGVAHDVYQQSWLLCSVADTGVGISNDKQTHLFERFSIANNTDYLNSDCGVGLGIPITLHLVSLHGGNMRVESTMGTGTTIYFTLGFDLSDDLKSKSELEEYYLNKHILLVSDMYRERELMFRVVSPYGAKPIMCSIPDVQMYLTSDMFSFDMVIISVNDSSMSITNINPKCPLYVFYQTKKQVSNADYYCKKPIEKHSVVKMLNMAMTQPADHVSESDEPQKGIQDTIKIIIAEDHKENQLVISKLLHSLDYYDITMTSNGLELYMKLMNEDYDVAFIDLKMPVMDGITAVKQFKAKSSKSIVLVAVTASMSEHIRQDCYKAGMDGYITKPIDRNELKSTLNTVVRKKMSEL